jgi:flagellar hook-associated protein 1 FlgK
VSTFSGLNTAYRGLVAARQGLDVVGQNITNANTVGYTRQRAVQTSVGSPAQVGAVSGQITVGQGVSVDSISRLGNEYLDTRVRTSVASSGYWGVRANELSTLQKSLHEPGTGGLSAQLDLMWGSWQDLANKPGDPAVAAVLLQQSGTVATQLAVGYQDVDDQWSVLRSQVDGLAAEVNDAATQVAALNGLIRSTLASGASANELIDQRSLLTTTISTLTGGSVRTLPDGTAEVLVGGNALVSGDRSYAVAVTGSTSMTGAAADPVGLVWAGRPGVPLSADGGEIAGALSMLAPSTADGTGGALAEAAANFNDFAVYLAETVNAVHRTGTISDGTNSTTGRDFFALGAGPAALGLRVVPTSVDGIAAAAPGAGGLDGSIAAAISQLGTGPGSPDARWTDIVTGIGVATRTGLQQSVLADLSSTAAANNQRANASVDLDEENVNMLAFQTAYQGAARVMTAVDEMLDTLINRTGLVGR